MNFRLQFFVALTVNLRNSEPKHWVRVLYFILQQKEEEPKSEDKKEEEEVVSKELAPEEEASLSSKLQFAGSKFLSYAKESTVMAGKGLEAVKSAVEKHVRLSTLFEQPFSRQSSET